MSKLNPKFGVVIAILGSAVANAGTFDLPYPTGYVQNNFNSGLNIAGAYMVVNDNDKYDTTKIAVSYGASLITITNNTGATLAAGAKVAFYAPVAAGNSTEVLAFPVDLATIAGVQDVLTTFRPGVSGIIEDVSFAVDKPVTTAAKLATISPFINAVAVTGGALALTSALATPKGKVIQGAAVTALNAFTAADTISLKATGVTAFAEGSGTVFVRVRKSYPDQY